MQKTLSHTSQSSSLSISSKIHAPTSVSHSKHSKNKHVALSAHSTNNSELYSPPQKNRSISELSMAGESKDVIDNVQYYLDGMLSKTVNQNTRFIRRQYSQKLLHLFDIQTNAINIIKSHHNMDKLLRGFGKVLYDQDHYTNVFICLLITVICSHDDGSFDDSILMPIECFVGLLQVIVVGSGSVHDLTSSEEVVKDCSSSLPDSNDNAFARKRKRAIQSSPPVDHDSTPINHEFNEILTLLEHTKHMPLIRSIIGNNQHFSIDARSLSHSLSLNIVSSCLTAKAQRFTALLNNTPNSKYNNAFMCANLADFQDAMNLEHEVIESPNHNNSQDPSFLETIVRQSQDILDAFPFKNSKKTSFPKSTKVFILIHYLSILEAASFRNQSNQICILAKCQSNSQSCQASNLITLLISTIEHMVPSVINKVKDKSRISMHSLINGKNNLTGESNPVHAHEFTDEDIYLSCLRLLVNLTHSNPEVCKYIVEGQIQRGATSNPSILSYLCTILQTYICERSAHKTILHSENSLAVSATLSPDETFQDRYLFDTVLYILTVLANIVESLPSSIPYLLSIKTTIVRQNSPITRRSSESMLEYLIEVLLEESSSLIKDIESIDDSSKSPTKSLLPEYLTTGTTQERLPVAEIILSAHLCILVTSIAMNWSNTSNTSRVSPLAPSSSSIVKSIKAKLPKQSWWLPIRILKAFIVLQGKTGVLIRDTVDSILGAIKFMELDEKVAESSSDMDSLDASDLFHSEQFDSYTTNNRNETLKHSANQQIARTTSASLTKSEEVDWLCASSSITKSNDSSPQYSTVCPNENSKVKSSSPPQRKNRISLWTSILPNNRQPLFDELDFNTTFSSKSMQPINDVEISPENGETETISQSQSSAQLNSSGANLSLTPTSTATTTSELNNSNVSNKRKSSNIPSSTSTKSIFVPKEESAWPKKLEMLSSKQSYTSTYISKSKQSNLSRELSDVQNTQNLTAISSWKLKRKFKST